MPYFLTPFVVKGADQHFFCRFIRRNLHFGKQMARCVKSKQVRLSPLPSYCPVNKSITLFVTQVTLGGNYDFRQGFTSFLPILLYQYH